MDTPTVTVHHAHARPATTTKYEKIERKRPWKMSIRLYFKPVSSLHTPEETGIGAVATKKPTKPCSVSGQSYQTLEKALSAF